MFFIKTEFLHSLLYVLSWLQCQPGYVVGIQLLNPIHNRSTEDIVIYDARTVNSSARAWSLQRDLFVFPTISSSYGVLMQYQSGTNALGGAVLAVSTVPGNHTNESCHYPPLTFPPWWTIF
jgi:hypothetical protein